MLCVPTLSSLRTRSSMFTRWMSQSLAATRALLSSLFYHKVCGAFIIYNLPIGTRTYRVMSGKNLYSQTILLLNNMLFRTCVSVQLRKQNSQRRTSKLYLIEFNLEVMKSFRQRTVQDQPLYPWWVPLFSIAL